jgi:heme-degrading monooxygenase HmoA
MRATATTPKPPYYAVIFTSVRTPVAEGYAETSARMFELAAEQEGFLGVESARDDSLGITVSYWSSLEAIRAWRRNAEHRIAQERGRSDWYREYAIRVARVERAYDYTGGAP